MKIQKLNICFSRYTDADLLNKAEGCLLALTLNSLFPTISLTDLQAAITAYTDALTAATDRSRGNIALKDEARQALEASLRQLGLTVMSLANGNANMLATTGFTLSKQPSSIYITNPGTVKVKSGITSGQLEASVAGVAGAKVYFHQITPDPLTEDSNWESNTSSRSKHTFSGLIPGKKYWLRVAVVGSGDQVAYGTASATFVM